MSDVAQFTGMRDDGASNKGAVSDITNRSFPGRESSVAGEGPMPDEQFQAVMKNAINDATDYIDGFIAPLRAQTVRYYRAELYGNEEEGRSQIVTSEVRDKIQAVMPDLLRIFCSGDKVVEYVPNNERQVEQAEQQTAYANHVFFNDNPGFMILRNWIMDALKTGTGIVTWRWSTDTKLTESDFTGLDEGQFALLHSYPDVEIIKQETRQVQQEPSYDEQGQPQPVPPETVYDVRIRRKVPQDRAVIECFPVEEFLVARAARDTKTSAYVGRRQLVTISDLVSMGYDYDLITEYAGLGDTFVMNYETQTRNPSIMSFTQRGNENDLSMRLALYVESYIRIDRDGDGIAELRRVCTLGGPAHILHDEVIDAAPIAFLCPDPEPHMVIGQSLSDQLMDIQKISSNVTRAMLDSLSQAIYPRTVVVETQVNMDDVLNKEMGAIIRARQPGMVQEMQTPFLGQSALQVMQYLSDLADKRTGVVAASQGLDPDVLQSTTQAAVTATVNGAQNRTELIARTFAETGIRDLFRGLRDLLIKHQDKPRIVRLQGKFVEVDPRAWDADLDVSVNVALGKGTDADKVQSLMAIAAKQEQIIQTLGPGNPLADVSQYRNTLVQIVNLMGFKDGDKYFKTVDPQVLQQAMQATQNKPDPNMIIAQAEQAKVQAGIQNDQMKLALEKQKADNDHAQKMAKIHTDMMMGLAEMEAKYHTQINLGHLQAEVDRVTAIEAASIQGAVDAHGNHLTAQNDRYALQNPVANGAG